MTLGLRKQERQFSLRGEYRDGSNANKATSCPSLPGTNRFLGYRTSVLKPGKFQSKQGRLDHSSRNKICTESMFSSLLPTTPQLPLETAPSLEVALASHPQPYLGSRAHPDCLKLKHPIGLGKGTKLRPKGATVEIQIKTTMRYHFASTSTATIKKMDQNKGWQGCTETGTLIHCW